MIVARQPYRVIFPILLIIGGVLILLVNMGTLPEDAGWRLIQLWPLLLVMLGVQILLPHVARGAAVPALTLALVGVIAVSGLLYVVAGPSVGAGDYTRFHSTSPVAGVSAGSVTINAAPQKVTITARDIGAQLYDANVDYVGSAPQFSYADGNVRISRDSNVFSTWGRSRDVVDLAVNPAVAWAIKLNSAGTTTAIDLSNGTLQSFTLNGAGCNVTLVAGLPHGIVNLTVSGAGNGLTLQLPAGAQYRVTTDGLGNGGAEQSAGWSSAADRYDVHVSGVGNHATVSAAG